MNIAFYTLGCKVNQYETQVMREAFIKNGHTAVPTSAPFDALVINSCTVTAESDRKTRQTLHRFRKNNPNACIALTGCMVQAFSEKSKQLDGADIIIGNTDVLRVVQSVEQFLIDGKPVFEVSDHKRTERFNTPPITEFAERTRAYMKIEDGCDRFCTYCIIPKLRGKYRSRDFDDVIREAKALVADGIRELIIIAQDTTRYGMDLYGKYRLSELLRELCKIEDLHWLRVHYLYPEVITDELISVFAEEDKIVKYMDIPIQHCNNEVLKRMGRHGGKNELVELINKLRNKIPSLIIRTTVICGFPGETNEQFEELLGFVKEMKFERLGAFAYSQEEDTPAAKLPDQIPQEIKEERATMVLAEQSKISFEHQQNMLGKLLEVLVEGYDDENLMYFGRSYADSIDIDTTVYFAAEDEVEIGSFVTVRILDADEYDLTGKLEICEGEGVN